MVVFWQFLDSLNHCLPPKNYILIKIFKVDLIGNLLTAQPPVVYTSKMKAKFMFLYSVKWCSVNICQQMYHFLLFRKIWQRPHAIFVKNEYCYWVMNTVVFKKNVILSNFWLYCCFVLILMVSKIRYTWYFTSIFLFSSFF